MKKRLGRRLKKSLILVVIVLAAIVAIWGLSHMGGVLRWLLENWLAFTAGAGVTIIVGTVVDTLFDDKEK